MHEVPAFTLYSAFVLLVTAGVVQCTTRRVCPCNAALLLCGAVSVMHHSRLHKWHIYDCLRACDVGVALFTGILLIREHHANARLMGALLYCACAIALAWFVPLPYARSAMHASGHCMLAIALLHTAL